MDESDAPPAIPLPSTLKRINMRRFLEELRRRGPSSRADLTRAVGVTPPTSSSIIADLMQSGLLEEADTVGVGRGRPAKNFQLARNSAHIIGATLDIHECRVAGSSLAGEIQEEGIQRFATPGTYMELLDSLERVIKEVSGANPGNGMGVGLAVPGLINERTGEVALSPNLRFLDGKRLQEDMGDRLGLEVACTQEEHALCLSEQHIGGAQGLAHFAVVDFSSGVGMGVVNDGKYLSGANGFAGEIGHTTVVSNGRECGCGNRGCLETVASDLALVREFSESRGRTATFEDLQEAYRNGDPEARALVDTTLDYIAIGLANAVNLFNPTTLFLHGKAFSLDEEILKTLLAKVRSRALGPSSQQLDLRLAKGTKMHGAVTGMLNRLFASVGPTLS